MSSDKMIKPPASWKKAASTSIIPPIAIATTIRNCNNDEDGHEIEKEIAAPARRIIPKPSSGTTTTATTIRSHSPRKMQTHTAKLVYNPSMTTKSNRDDVNEIEKTVIVAEVGEFQKKRLDRDREVKEIQEMLNEITKTPTKPTKKPIATEGEGETSPTRKTVVVAAKNSPPKQPTNTIQRSKTDTNLRRPTARKIQPRQESQTATTTRCKSAHVEDKSSPPKQRQKTYSSEEAQRYMQEQRKKRRSLQTVMQGSDSKPTIDKDEIKKRLENLRQNTRKIVDKNVKIAKKKAGTAEDKPPQPLPLQRREEPRDIRNRMNKETEVPLKTKGLEAWSERVLKPPASSRRNYEEYDVVRSDISNDIEIPAKTSRIEAWAEKVRPVKSSPENRQDPSPLAENCKKIGLLRKPEFKDHSFSAIKDIHMDKENLIADILTPQISGLPTSRLVADGENLLANAMTPHVVGQLSTTRLPIESAHQQTSIISNHTNLEQKLSESSLYGGKSLKRRSSPELDLQVPEAKLRSRTSVREKSVQADSTVFGSSKGVKKNAELPYWLKPTLVQAYPYNFIMAVRKKLEAIANPPAVASSSSSSIEQQVAKKTTAETPVSYQKANRSNNVKRRIIDNENDRSLEKSSSNKENIGQPRLSKSFSEVTSNFSSISIKLPQSNSTKVSNHKTEPEEIDEDATTVSSSIFSSPEKKKNFNGRSKNFQPEALSPLSMDNISNLHIKSKAVMSNITLERGDDFENYSSHRSGKSGSMTNRSNASVDFSQLLDDFNRSLSQVIEVNQQLKTTLVKSQIFSPEKKPSSVLTTNRVELAEYVSDFEESSNAGEKSASIREPRVTQSSSSIHEVQESSKQSSSEIHTQKSSSASSSNEEVPEEEITESQSSFKNNLSRRSSNQSPLSLGTQTFIVSSSEEKAQNSTQTQTIHEEAIEESPNKENMSGNQYSLDSLEETSQHEDYIKSHINTSRGDYERIELLSAGPPPPSYKVSSESQARSSPNFINNSSMDSEFVRIFNKSDMEISVLSLNRSLSESTVNYSSIGMYEKLIQNETNKSDHLAALLKMREKALIDRTKGQIAWLEVQKERYKSKGLILQISAVKKKQRGILLKMEKEREEIKKLLQRAKVQRDDNKLRIPEIRPFSDVSLLQQRRSGIQVSSTSQQKQHHHQQQQHQHNNSRSKSSSAIVKGYELETSRSLEQLLQKREEDLRRRREHVERLMEWHRRLDQEEAEVLQLERILLDYNNVHVQQQQQHQQNDIVAVQERNPNQAKMEKKLKDIDRSLRELSSISGADGSTDAGVGVGSGEFVRTSGTKLNKLWRRLTSQRIEKFQPNKRYKLCKADVEQLYEDAKLAVLHDFGENAGQMEVFLGQTSIISTPQPSINHSMEIPQLNLNFSSGQSCEEDIMMRGNYSPSAAEQGFVMPSTSSQDGLSDDSSLRRKTTSRNSSSSAMQSLPERYSSNSKSQKSGLENVQNREATESITSKGGQQVDSKSRFSSSTQCANVSSGISINYVLSSKVDSDPRVSTTDSSTDSNKSKTENVPNNDIVDAKSSRSLSTSIAATKSSQTKSNESSGITKETETEKSHRKTSQIESDPALTRNDTETLGNASNTIEDIASSIPELQNAINLTESTSQSLSDFTQSSAHNSSTNAQLNSEIETNKSISSDRTKTRESGSTKKHIPEKSSSEIIETAQSLLKNSSGGASVSEWISKNSSENVLPITEKTTSHTENVSNIKTPTESLKKMSSSIKSQTLTNANTSLSIISSSSQENDTPSEPIENKNSIVSECSRNDEVARSSSAPVSNSAKSSEECATVSILKSLLNSTYNSSSIIFASNQVSDIEAQLRTNGHDWTNNLNQANEDESPATQVSSIPTESLTFPDEATLRSIKSIDDNSTNSKHSIEQPISNQNPINQISTEVEVVEEEDIHLSRIPNSKSSSSLEDVHHHHHHQSYSSAFEDSVSSNSNSNQIRSSVIMSIKESEPLTNAFYESDFTEGEETNIDDISLPKFETTAEEEEEQQLNESPSQSASNRSDFEKRLINLDVSLKDLDATFEKALSPEKTLSPPRDDDSKRNQQQNDSALMPDIISEVELRRRHQAMLENELKQFEHAVPYMYVREIPNKPPPPYVPPAHGSPMTTIFPSEERIKDITFRRTKELYCEILNIDTKDDLGKKPPSVLDENITNIYERIILDICKEYLTEYKPILTSADPNNFHSSLAFFNPPDRLKCMQEFIYKEVRKNLAMDKNAPEKSQLYSVYGHRGKRDHVGEIIIQEMFEEDNMWSNFYVEEEEVLELIIDEIVSASMRDICTAVLDDEGAPRDDSIIPTPTTDADESVEMCCNNST